MSDNYRRDSESAEESVEAFASQKGQEMKFRAGVFMFSAVILLAMPAKAQNKVPPYDLWTAQVLSQIRDRSTLDLSTTARAGYWDVFFTSNPSADWFEHQPPYAEHRNEKIRIHAYLAAPAFGGPYPALVIGHGHGGRADRDLTQLVAALGYVALSIDGPQAGQSTGGPTDHSQAWISVDRGPHYGYLYHYDYAGMRALTVLEALAAASGNPYRIDSRKLGVLGASMGGIFTTHINGIDDRVKAAIIIASAGNWHHALRYPNAWLYNGIYTETRDQPYNGNDPLNSIENIDNDSTAFQFLNYFDPIRYALRQNAPVLTVIGTHDDYFPMPSANLMHQAISSAGINSRFEKRLWLLANTPHGLESGLELLPLALSLRQWLEYCFGNRDKPLATPQVAVSQDGGGVRFEVTLAEPAARLSGVRAVVYAGTRIDDTTTPIQDLKSYNASREADRFVVRIPSGERSSSGDLLRPDNIVYYATATDADGLSVSSLFYKASQMLDLSSDFVPGIRHISSNNMSVPLPPAVSDAASAATSSVTLTSSTSYQGVALTNATAQPITVRVDARNSTGRIAASEGLINPIFVSLPPNSQQVFLAEEWMGSGARRLDGHFRMGWSDARGASLAFRGDVLPSELEGIGPMGSPATRLWVPLAPELDLSASRRIRVISAPGSAATEIQIVFRTREGATLETRQVSLQPGGTVDLTPPSGAGSQPAASAEIGSTIPVSARLEVRGGRDPWSIEARVASQAPGTGRVIQPHAEWNGIFTTRLLMLNTSASDVSATLRRYTSAGSAIESSVQFVVPGNGVVSETVENLFGIAPPATRGAGWLMMESPGAELLTAALTVDATGGAAAASALEPGVGSSWSLPFFVNGMGYYTGLALANAADTASTVTLIAYDKGGAVLRRANVTLGPRQSRTELVSQWLPELQGDSFGHLMLMATAPVSLLAYFGTDDGASLAAIPFRALSP